MKSNFNAKLWNYGAKFRKEIPKTGNSIPTWRTWKLIAMKEKVRAIQAPNLRVSARKMLPSAAGVF